MSVETLLPKGFEATLPQPVSAAAGHGHAHAH